MRIQHNIMAMGAYRNYTNNVNAMKKNLEKLSSGYKINRAGDDAAGLAISEKMRAQITGLETAQKNAKDGISLVQTAEGALTEVHDMLNRMVSLATQSANGTYDNETDRAQLQKEVSQLLDEINRIADSSNFNGIKLLDGSMDATPIAGALTNLKATVNGIIGQLPEVGKAQELGVHTVLHKGASNSSSAQFGVSLHNVTYSNDDANGEITIKFGNDTIKLTGGATKATMEVSGLVDKLTSAASGQGGTGHNVREMQIGGTTGTTYVVEGETLEDQLNSWVEQFNADTTANGNGALVAERKGATIEFTATAAGTAGDGQTIGSLTTAGGVNAVKQKNTGTVAVSGIADGDQFTINGVTYDVVADATAVGNYTGPNTAIAVAGVTATWAAGELQAAGAFSSLDGFASFSNANGATFDIEALNAGAATAENKLGASDVSTDLSAYITGAAANKFSVSYAQDTAGVDEVKSHINSGTVPCINSTLEIAGFKAEITTTDPNDQIEEFMRAYNGTSTNKFVAEWNDTGDGIKFTAKEAGKLGLSATVGTDDNATAVDNEQQFQATAIDGADSVLGTNKGMDAKAILDAIKSGKATLSKNNGAYVPLTQKDIANGVELSDGAKYKISFEGDTITFTQLDTDVDAANKIKPTVLDREVTISGNINATTKKNMVSGDYQKSTTFNTPNDTDSGNRLASTWFENNGDNVVDGGAIFIGGKNYQFTLDAEAVKNDATKVFIGDLMDSETGKFDDSDENITKLNERITVAAKDNEVYTVGYDTTRLTFTERVGYTTGNQEYDLTKLSEIERSLGFTGPETPSEGKSLTLQIGDTAEEFNQLKVNIKDMHAESLGIADLDISTQDGAAIAVDKIKNAINTVSDVRGTLGATQNRLDHTINNLSVMTENIQDAESTIRDTDVAAEMMQYTKNNILIQSAQAMLAQANQVPQGVLQLLQ